jgi:hypothetical protein
MTRFALAAPGLRSLAGPMLLGLLFLAPTGGPSSASQPPTLVTPSRAAAPAAFQIISPPATVLDVRHYMAKLELTCSGMACLGDLPTTPAKRRLNITWVTCTLLGTLGSTASGGYLELQRADNWPLLDQYLPVNNSVPDERIGSLHTLNEAVDMQVLPGQHARLGVFAASGTAKFATCSVSGSLELLQ